MYFIIEKLSLFYIYMQMQTIRNNSYVNDALYTEQSHYNFYQRHK